MSPSPKYRLKNSPAEYETVDEVCIACGKRNSTKISITPELPRPNHAQLAPGLIFTPGSRLGCLLGNHDYYFEYELEPAS